jgi:ankyrin repeat protein
MSKRAMKWSSSRVVKIAIPFVLLFAVMGAVGVREYKRSVINQKLINAVEKDDANAVLGALSMGADPNARWSAAPPQSNSFARLWHMLRGGSRHSEPVLCRVFRWRLPIKPDPMGLREIPAIATALLERGADPNEGNGNRTPLMLALNAKMPNVPVVRLLLDKGANLRARDKAGMTPLFFACSSEETTSLLLARGANPNDQDNKLRTPVIYARTPGVAKVLINKGATIPNPGKAVYITGR